MDLYDLLGDVIGGYPQPDADLCKVIAWANEALKLAYAAGDFELEDQSIANCLKREALNLRHNALALSGNNKFSDSVVSCAGLNEDLKKVAVQLKRVCESVLPEILPYYEVNICT